MIMSLDILILLASLLCRASKGYLEILSGLLDVKCKRVAAKTPLLLHIMLCTHLALKQFPPPLFPRMRWLGFAGVVPRATGNNSVVQLTFTWDTKHSTERSRWNLRGLQNLSRLSREPQMYLLEYLPRADIRN